ncbi:MAG: peptidylprolyl isomerase [Elusimicrobia bacterium]|nr:peptidylprolyl isomerase [Candidatus Liberimonas magnetica]
MSTAKARHILVLNEEECKNLKAQIMKGSDFAAIAKKHSKCPSGKQGGYLGEFCQGEMVKAFDEVVFKEEIGKIHGPVKTQFGYHLIEIMERED